MLFDAINRENLLAAAAELNQSGETVHTDFWIHINETGRDYPFKRLVRKAYDHAAGREVEPGFFRNNHSYRRYFERKYNYRVFFRVRDNIPFFNENDFDYFTGILDQPYRSNDPASRAIGENLKKGIFLKTNTWARAINSDELEVSNDNRWQIAGHFKRYSWATIYRAGAQNKKIFFTVGVDVGKKSLVYKLDCQRESSHPGLCLTDYQIAIFDRIVGDTGAAFKSIHKAQVVEYSWSDLIDETEDFINHYLPLYDEAVEAVWAEPEENPHTKTDNSETLVERPVPPGKLDEIPPYTGAHGGDDNPNYDEENKHKKAIGTAGEELIITAEKRRLVAAGRSDLADNVKRVYDRNGYDIISYQVDNSPKYIEVKTTPGSRYRPFILTRNERKCMMDKQSAYYLYRIYAFDFNTGKGEYFILQGDFTDRVLQEPLQFNIHLKRI